MPITLDEVLKNFQNGPYKKGSDAKRITLDSKQLFEQSHDVADMLIGLCKRFDDDIELVAALFVAAFTCGRMYERKLNDPNLYN